MPIYESYGLRFFVPFRTGVSKPEWREASIIALQENYYLLLFFNCFRWRASRKTVTLTPFTILLFCSTKQQSFKQHHHYYCKSFIMYVQDNSSFIYGTDFIIMATVTLKDTSFLKRRLTLKIFNNIYPVFVSVFYTFYSFMLCDLCAVKIYMELYDFYLYTILTICV